MGALGFWMCLLAENKEVRAIENVAERKIKGGLKVSEDRHSEPHC
jgi:hypothetical protein